MCASIDSFDIKLVGNLLVVLFFFSNVDVFMCGDIIICSTIIHYMQRTLN